MKYRKKPVVIEAVQFTDENKDAVFRWASSIQMNIAPSFDGENNPILIIPTLDGEMICSIGDYLIKEPFPTDWRKIYPCKPDIFDKTYEVAGNEPKIRITSDGVTAKIHIHGEQVRCRAIDFHGDAENGIHISWDYETIREDENGKILIEDDVVATETVHFDNMERD